MTQFFCNNVSLDLYDDTALAFSKKNILFAFDQAECERTASFSIPATKKNNQVFERANMWDNTLGTGMCKKYDVRMIDGIVVMDGYLYLTKYDPNAKSYTAVFVTGGYLQLKKLRDAGKLGVVFDESIMRQTTTYNKVTSSVHEVWGTYSYYYLGQPNGQNFPSMSVAHLFSLANQIEGISVQQPTEVEEWYILPQKLINTAGDDAAVGDSVRMHDNLPDITLAELFKAVAAMTGRLLNVEDDTIKFDNTDLSSWRKREFGNLIEISAVECKFYDAADNYIVAKGATSGGRFAELDGTGYGDLNILEPVPFQQSMPAQSKYHTSNENLSSRKTIMQLPFYGVSAIDWVEERNAPTIAKRNSSQLTTIAGVTSQGVYYPHTLPTNQVIAHLCGVATAISAKVYMPLMEFESIKPKDIVVVGGHAYVWTEAKWSSGVANLTLSMI